MTEKNDNQENKAPKEKKAKQAKQTDTTTSDYTLPGKEKKVSRWTMESCKRYARRFESLEEWSKGHPSSFKAASAKGWDHECMSHARPQTKHRAA